MKKWQLVEFNGEINQVIKVDGNDLVILSQTFKKRKVQVKDVKECKDLIKGIIISPKFIYHKTKLGEVVKVFYSPNANSLSIRSYDTHIILEASTLTADRAKRRIDSVRRDAYAIASIVVNDDVTFDEAIMIHTNRNNKG